MLLVSQCKHNNNCNRKIQNPKSKFSLEILIPRSATIINPTNNQCNNHQSQQQRFSDFVCYCYCWANTDHLFAFAAAVSGTALATGIIQQLLLLLLVVDAVVKCSLPSVEIPSAIWPLQKRFR